METPKLNPDALQDIYEALRAAAVTFAATFVDADGDPDNAASWDSPEFFGAYTRMRRALAKARGEAS